MLMSNGKKEQQYIKEILLESRYFELRDKSKTAAIGNLILCFIHQLTIFYGHNLNTINLICCGVMIVSSVIRLYHAKMNQLNHKQWLSSFTVISALSAVSWSALLVNTIFYFSHQPEIVSLTFIIFGGLFAASTYSLSISRLDFYVFQGSLFSGVLYSVFNLPNYESLRLSAIGYAAIFLFFISRQRKISSDFWHKQKILNFELQKILDTFPGGITLIQNNLYKRVNKYMTDSLGFKNEDLINKAVGESCPDSEATLFIQEQLKKVSTLEFDQFGFHKAQKEVLLKTNRGDRYHLLIVDTVSKSPSITETIVISIDIHDQKMAQQEIDRQRVSLQESSKMASLGEMSSGLAHEINNPLSIISAKTQFILMSLRKHDETFDKEKIITSLETINKTSFRIAKIIKGLKFFARETSNDPFEFCKFKEILTDTLTFCEAKIKSKNIDLIYDKVSDEILFEARPTQISQVLLNAISNSADAIEGLQEPKWIHIETKDFSDTFEIIITDSGHGIPESIRQKIMQPFFTTKEVGKGTGLGLSLSKGLIELHQGEFRFNYSHPNTQLIIRLPKFQNCDTKKIAS